jgi:hypothetical protein
MISKEERALVAPLLPERVGAGAGDPEQ